MMTRKCWKRVTKQDASFHDVLANNVIKTTKRCGTVGVSEIIRMPLSSQTEILKCYYLSCGPGSSVGIATGYGLDGPGNESQWGGGEIFRTFPDRPWGPYSLLYNRYRVFPGCKERPGRDADPSPLLLPWSRKGRAIPLLPLWAVRPVQSLSACTRVHFTIWTDLLGDMTVLLYFT